MTPVETETIKKLFKYATVAQEMEFVNLKTVDHFNMLRELYGLSKLLMLIQEYANNQANQTRAQTSETTNPHQDQAVV